MFIPAPGTRRKSTLRPRCISPLYAGRPGTCSIYEPGPIPGAGGRQSMSTVFRMSSRPRASSHLFPDLLHSTMPVCACNKLLAWRGHPPIQDDHELDRVYTYTVLTFSTLILSQKVGSPLRGKATLPRLALSRYPDSRTYPRLTSGRSRSCIHVVRLSLSPATVLKGKTVGPYGVVPPGCLLVLRWPVQDRDPVQLRRSQQHGDTCRWKLQSAQHGTIHAHHFEKSDSTAVHGRYKCDSAV